MTKCKIKGCKNNSRNKSGKNQLCSMHLERIRRHGYPELKKDRGEHGLEKLPHTIDNFILDNYKDMIDEEIVQELKKKGFQKVTVWNVKYRRRKLGVKKYLSGDIKKHKAWIRSQAIKRYGNSCELCGYNMIVETHHIIPKYQGGVHEIENLTVVCPNCHSLITRGKITLNNRDELPRLKKNILLKLKGFYAFL